MKMTRACPTPNECTVVLTLRAKCAQHVEELEHNQAAVIRLKAELERLSALWIAETRENERLRAAMQEACDILAERTQGSAARSPGHNARIRLEAAQTLEQKGDNNGPA